MRNPTLPTMLTMLAMLVMVIWAVSPAVASNGARATAATSGAGVMVVGPEPYNLNSTRPMEGSIRIEVVNAGDRWSQVQDRDQVNVVTEFSSGGSTYRINIDRPMPRHPLGKYTTWVGVVFNAQMHGMRTGIGTNAIPEVKPEIALWGWAEVARDGQVIAKMAPAHVMVMTRPPLQGVTLEVGTEDKVVLGVPDGYIHVMWPQTGTIMMPTAQRQARETIGWILLLGLAYGSMWLAARERTPAGSP